jgi:uncharacterized protein YkwD
MRHAWIVVLTALGASLLGCGPSEAGPACGAGDASEVCQVFRLVNEERAAAGLPAYAWDPYLALAAQRHAEDMAAQDYFDHTSLDGRSFSDRTREAGYDGSPRGENIARGYRTPEAVMEGWMSSPGHRANILSAGSNEIGVGLRDFRWVQVFGARAAR